MVTEVLDLERKLEMLLEPSLCLVPNNRNKMSILLTLKLSYFIERVQYVPQSTIDTEVESTLRSPVDKVGREGREMGEEGYGSVHSRIPWGD